LVRVVAGAEAVVSLALNQVWVMRTLAAALAARQEGARCDMVTLEGEILWGNGAVTGGVLEGIGVGALSQRREIDELNHGIADLQARLEVSQKQHAELSQRMAAENAALEALSLDAHAREVALVHAQQDVRRMTEQLEALGTQGQALTVEQFGLQNGLDALLEARRNHELDLQARRVWAGESAARLAQWSAALETLSLRRAQTRERLTELKIKAASGQHRADATREQIERNEVLSEELRERLRVAEEEASLKVGRIEELTTQVAAIAQRLEDLSRRRDDAAEALAGSVRAQAERTAEVDRFEEQSRILRQDVEQARTELSKLQLREQEITLLIGHLAASARDRHDVELESEVARFHLVPAPGPVERERLSELRDSIARMGEVNLTAISEYEELASRYQTLTEQQRDLERSVVQLKQAIVRINRTSRERFRETFELVNAQFAEVFPRLFRGGKAGLVLTEEDGEILEAGVEIFAQPPGKRLQSVNLLSGGEKALTAVALIFAIFLIKPTPFCLLDEVDAPLDDANVDRYNELVREISKISQFILITHNKRTMEIGDTLYGVTMEEPGCSKLVSVKLRTGQPEVAAA
jgi:chromosome segregation protein